MANPNPGRVTNEMWWLWEQLQALELTSQLGGFYAFKSGYHSSRNDNAVNWPGDYSIQDPLDLTGPGDKSAALDWTFPEAQRGDYSRIAKYCQRLMASSLDSNDPRLDGLREWYGQTDADGEVEGYDNRYLHPADSDQLHLWHIHFSFSRSMVNALKVMLMVLSVLRGESYATYLSSSGQTPAPLLVPPIDSGEDMPWTDDQIKTVMFTLVSEDAGGAIHVRDALMKQAIGALTVKVEAMAEALPQRDDALLGALQRLAAGTGGSGAPVPTGDAALVAQVLTETAAALAALAARLRG